MKSTITLGGALTCVMLEALAVFLPATALFSGPSPAPKAAPRSTASERHCLPVGGTVMTNFGAIDLNTTMGTATGDLRGAVPSTRGPGWTDLWCTSCSARSIRWVAMSGRDKR